MISNPYKKAASVLGFSQTSLRRWENEYHLNCFMDTDGSQHVIPKRLPSGLYHALGISYYVSH